MAESEEGLREKYPCVHAATDVTAQQLERFRGLRFVAVHLEGDGLIDGDDNLNALQRRIGEKYGPDYLYALRPGLPALPKKWWRRWLVLLLKAWYYVVRIVKPSCGAVWLFSGKNPRSAT